MSCSEGQQIQDCVLGDIAKGAIKQLPAFLFVCIINDDTQTHPFKQDMFATKITIR